MIIVEMAGLNVLMEDLPSNAVVVVKWRIRDTLNEWSNRHTPIIPKVKVVKFELFPYTQQVSI
jgi:hypothetical protein